MRGENFRKSVGSVYKERERELKNKEKGAYGSFILGPLRPGAVTPVGSAMVPSLSFFFLPVLPLEGRNSVLHHRVPTPRR